MKKILSAVSAFLLAVSTLYVVASADNRNLYEVDAGGMIVIPGGNEEPDPPEPYDPGQSFYAVDAVGIPALPTKDIPGVINVTLPYNMSFVFDPYGLYADVSSKVDQTSIICNYECLDENAWVIKNNGGYSIKIAMYAYATKWPGSRFSVRDANINTIETDIAGGLSAKYLMLEIKANGGVEGEQAITLLDEFKQTDEGENSKQLKTYKEFDWWAEENSDTITIISGVKPSETVNITMEGIAKNDDDLPWSRFNYADVHFVFNFDLDFDNG